MVKQKLWERPLSPSNFEGVPEGRGSLYITMFFNLLFIRKSVLKIFLYKLPRPAVRFGTPSIKIKRNLANCRSPLQNLKGIWALRHPKKWEWRMKIGYHVISCRVCLLRKRVGSRVYFFPNAMRWAILYCAFNATNPLTTNH